MSDSSELDADSVFDFDGIEVIETYNGFGTSLPSQTGLFSSVIPREPYLNDDEVSEFDADIDTDTDTERNTLNNSGMFIEPDPDGHDLNFTL